LHIEPFWSDLLVSSLGAFIGIGGAYLLYWQSIKKSRSDNLTYVVTLLNEIIPSTQQQAANCKEQAIETRKKPLEMPLLKLVADPGIKRIAEKVDQQGLYHAFLAKYGRNKASYKWFRNIYGLIDYINGSIDQLLSFNEKTIHAIWERKKAYGSSFTRAKVKIESILIDQDYDAYAHENFEFLNNSLHEFFDNNHPGENLVHTYTSLIKPVRNHLIAKGHMNPHNTELLFMLNEAENNYKGIEMAANSAADDYEETGNDLEKKANELREETKRLVADFSE
jgi:hypothetical protein